MASVNRYDRPAESNVQNTYVPLPMELLYKVAQHKQQQYDDSRKAELMLGDVAVEGVKARKYVYDPALGKNVKIADYDQAQSFLNDFNSRLETISSRIGTGDKGSPIYKMELEKLKRDLYKAKSPTGVLGRTTANADIIEQYEKAFQEDKTLRTKGWRANEFSKYLNKYASSNELGEFSGGIGLGEDVDRIKGLTDHLDKMKMELKSVYAGATGNGYTQEGFMRWIDPERIKNSAATIINNGSIGRDILSEADNLRMRGASEEEVSKYVNDTYNNLISGMVNMFYESEGRQSVSSDATFWKQREWDKENSFGYSTSQLPVVGTEAEQLLNKFKNLNGKGNEAGSSFTTRAPGGAPISTTSTVTKEQEESFLENDKYIKDFKKQFPELTKGKTNKEILNQAIKYYESEVTKSGTRYDPNDSEFNTAVLTQLFNNLDVANFTVIDKENQTTNNVTERDNLLQEFGLSRNQLPEFKQLMKEASIGIDFNTGKFVAEIPKVKGASLNESGKLKTKGVKELKHVEFEGDEESRAVLKSASNINNLYNKPSGITNYDKEATDVKTNKKVKISSDNSVFLGVSDENGPLFISVTGDKDFDGKGDRKIWFYSPQTGEVEETSLQDVNKKYTELIGQRLKALGKNLE